MTGPSKRGNPVRRLLVLNAILWSVFWIRFFSISEVFAPGSLAGLSSLRHNHPDLDVVFGRAVLARVDFEKALVSLWNLPTLFVSKALLRAVPGDVFVLRTNWLGLILICMTMLSFLQWYGIGLLFRRRQKRMAMGHNIY
jgi:hypothetical protein